MQVAHIDTGTEWRGGQRQVLRLVQGLEARGLRPIVLCPRSGRLFSELEFLGARRQAIPPGVSLRGIKAIRQSQATSWAAHTSHAHSMCALARVPFVVHRRVDFVPSSRWKYSQPLGFVAVSRAIADVLHQGGFGPVEVVYSGVPLVSAVAPALDGPTVLAVGACVAHKGHDVLANAAPQLPDLDIGVAGEGPDRFPNLRYLGDRDDVPALLAQAKVFVMPSRQEGLGTACIEAMLAGVPVVVSDAGGLPEVVGETGVVVPAGDPDALAEGIRQGLHWDPGPAKERATTLFSVEAMVEGTMAAYRSFFE